MESYSVPTQLGDENERPTTYDLFGESQHHQQGQDAFSRYSNEYFHMKSLLLLSGDLDLDDHDGDDDLDALATINRTFSSVGLSSLAPSIETSAVEEMTQDASNKEMNARRGCLGSFTQT
jgi:hypothetical protein